MPGLGSLVWVTGFFGHLGVFRGVATEVSEVTSLGTSWISTGKDCHGPRGEYAFREAKA